VCHVEKGFKEIVKNCWEKHHKNGNEMWILKEIVKTLKLSLRAWNKDVFGEMYRNKEGITTKISVLNKKDEEHGLSDQEREERKQHFAYLKKVNLRIEMIEKQKSRSKWLEASDFNSKFFHRLIKWRRMKNMIKRVKIGNEWCEEPTKVNEVIQDMYKNRFMEQADSQVRLDNVVFSTINKKDNDLL